MLTSSMLQGGMNASHPNPVPIFENDSLTPTLEYYHPINNFIASYAFGSVLVINRFSISSIQTDTPMDEGPIWSHLEKLYP